MLANHLIDRFSDLITHQAQVAKNLARANLLNRAVLAERLCARMAGILLDRQFESTNRLRANQDSYDLRSAKTPTQPAICAQVTIREDREKIAETLVTFFKHGHGSRYDSLYIFIIGYKPDLKKPFTTVGSFKFDAAEHVIDVPDMIRIATALPIGRLRELVETIEEEVVYRRSMRRFLRKMAAPFGAAVIVFLAGVAAAYAMGIAGNPGRAIPGETGIEQAINRAKIEGATLTEASSESVSAVAFAYPVLTPAPEAAGVDGGPFALSNSSPLRPENQDIVFAAGRCRFLGHANWPSEATPSARASISVVSCVQLNGDSYEYGSFDGPEIGYVTTLEHPASRELPVDKSQRAPTLSRDTHYVVRFAPPIHALTPAGKSSQIW